jgi:hypothetical protein
MIPATQKIWQAVTSLDRSDTYTAALCHAIINMMVHQGIVTREAANRQIEKSTMEVISVHKRIVKALQDMDTGPAAHSNTETIQ